MKNNSIIINYFMKHYNNTYKKHLIVIKNNSIVAIVYKIESIVIEKEYIMLSTFDYSIFVDSDDKVSIH